MPPPCKYSVNINSFLNEDDVSFYLLGAYMTDGNVITKKHHKNFSISSSDLDWIESIRSYVAPTTPIRKNKTSNNYVISNSNQQVLDWFLSYGCVPAKSKLLSLAKEIPTQYYRDFVRGAIDGDGSISYSRYSKKKNGKEYFYDKKVVYLCGASKIFLEQVQSMLPKDINSNIVNHGRKDKMIRNKVVKATCDIYRLIFNDSNAVKLLIWLYYPDHKISLHRKKIKAGEILSIGK